MHPTYHCEVSITYDTSKHVYTYNMFSITLNTTSYCLPISCIYIYTLDDIIYIMNIDIIYHFVMSI